VAEYGNSVVEIGVGREFTTHHLENWQNAGVNAVVESLDSVERFAPAGRNKERGENILE
jgi:hypothetical protein